MGLKQKLQSLALGAIEKFAPEAEEDSYLDLKREELEGKLSRAKSGVKDVAAEPASSPKPFYRSDGQVHSFEAVPFPGQERRLTRAQYEARYAGSRPEPRHSVAWIATAEPEPEVVAAPPPPAPTVQQEFRCYEDDHMCGDDFEDCTLEGDEE